MKPREPRTSVLHLRLLPQEHQAFSVKTQAFGGPTFVLRELISAFIEGRLVIKPPCNQPAEGIYHE